MQKSRLLDHQRAMQAQERRRPIPEHGREVVVTDEEVMIQGREAAVTKQQVTKPARN
jgi:hypothetical protein